VNAIIPGIQMRFPRRSISGESDIERGKHLPHHPLDKIQVGPVHGGGGGAPCHDHGQATECSKEGTLGLGRDKGRRVVQPDEVIGLNRGRRGGRGGKDLKLAMVVRRDCDGVSGRGVMLVVEEVMAVVVVMMMVMVVVRQRARVVAARAGPHVRSGRGHGAVDLGHIHGGDGRRSVHDRVERVRDIPVSHTADDELQVEVDDQVDGVPYQCELSKEEWGGERGRHKPGGNESCKTQVSQKKREKLEFTCFLG
jgi:hypothetical protein